MANTYNLEILKLQVKILENTLENVVFQADWRYTATSQDGKYVEEIVGLASIPAPDPDNFIPFENLTEEVVSDWILNIVNIEQLQEALDEQIAKKQYPTTESKNVPW